MTVNKIEKITTKGIKNFRVWVLKIITKKIEKTNNINGILLPDKIIPTKKIINKIGMMNLEKIFDSFW